MLEREVLECKKQMAVINDNKIKVIPKYINISGFKVENIESLFDYSFQLSTTGCPIDYDSLKYELVVQKRNHVDGGNHNVSVVLNSDKTFLNKGDKASAQYYYKKKYEIIEPLFYVESINFDNVYPKYSNADSNLEIRFDGKSLDLANRTDYYLQVKSISVYYNGDINNVSLNNAIELAPGAVYKDLVFSNFLNDKIISNAMYHNVDANKAKRTDINFGFALKYRLVEQNVDKTLYKQTSYNLFSVIMSIGPLNLR